MLATSNKCATIRRRSNIFVCPECNKEFHRKASLSEHLHMMHPEKEKCEMIGQVKRKRPQEIHVCEKCDKSCKTAHKLKEHIFLVHEKEKKRKQSETSIAELLPCSSCEIKCKSATALQRHVIKVHRRDQGVTCPDCEKWFVSNYELLRHKQAKHSVDRKFQCTSCQHSYISNSDLKKHLKTHEKPSKKLPVEEQILCDYLKKENLFCTFQTRVDFSWLDKAMTFSVVDFMLLEKQREVNYSPLLTDVRFVVEVDEQQHVGSSCEEKRVWHVLESLKYMRPDDCVVFIRYNPNAYFLNGRVMATQKSLRLETLIKFIKTYRPFKQVEVVYFYYDTLTEADQNGIVSKQLSLLMNMDKADSLWKDQLQYYQDLVTEVII